MDLTGGLAQALSDRGEPVDECRGWDLAQLKRALRGTAFSRGALLRAALTGSMEKDAYFRFHAAVASLQGKVLEEIREVRSNLGYD